ncbi:cytochrome C, partial [Sulfurimonas sp. SAG-AH-194-I05]
MKTTIKSTLKALVILGALVGATNVSASADLYKKCSSCHGQNGERKALGKSKVINTMSYTELVDSLKGYKNGTYGGPMKGLMKGQVARLSDADIE